eukprot:11730740-Karenia_brevis.AAC.1
MSDQIRVPQRPPHDPSFLNLSHPWAPLYQLYPFQPNLVPLRYHVDSFVYFPNPQNYSGVVIRSQS